MGVFENLAKAVVSSVVDAIKENQADNGNRGRPSLKAANGLNSRQRQEWSAYSIVVTDEGVVFPHVTYDADGKVFFAKWNSMVNLDFIDRDDGRYLDGTLRGGIQFAVHVGHCNYASSLDIDFLPQRARKAMDDEMFKHMMREWGMTACKRDDSAQKVFCDWMQGFLNSVRTARVFMSNEENDVNLVVCYSPVLERMKMVSANIGAMLEYARRAIADRNLDRYEGEVPLYYRWYGIPMLELLDAMIEDFWVDCLPEYPEDRQCVPDDFLEEIEKHRELIEQIRALDPSLKQTEDMYARSLFG